MGSITAAVAALAICTIGAIPATFAQANVVSGGEETGSCRAPYPTRVLYGVPGRVTTPRSRQVRYGADAWFADSVFVGGLPCNNRPFGVLFGLQY
jgi:hypothetical protein